MSTIDCIFSRAFKNGMTLQILLSSLDFVKISLRGMKRVQEKPISVSLIFSYLSLFPLIYAYMPLLRVQQEISFDALVFTPTNRMLAMSFIGHNV